MMFSAGYNFGSIFSGEVNLCADTFRYEYIPLEDSFLYFPGTGNPALDRIIRTIHIFQPLDRIRTKFDFRETGLQRTDSGEVFIFPDKQVSKEHDVVAGVHRRIGGVAVP